MEVRLPDVAFDPVLHQPARLKIAMLLAATSIGTFNELQAECGLTAGNLASHLKALEGVGYVRSRRGLVDLKPRVRYALTDEGRAALAGYCRALEKALRDLQRVVDAPPPDAKGTVSRSPAE